VPFGGREGSRCKAITPRYHRAASYGRYSFVLPMSYGVLLCEPAGGGRRIDILAKDRLGNFVVMAQGREGL
jgi:hypothetical protein